MRTKTAIFHRNILEIDPEKEVERIVARLEQDIFHVLKRKGGVMGVSGGVDSAVVLAIAVRVMPTSRLVALLLPERESSPESLLLGREVCHQFGVTPLVEDVSEPLYGFGSYRRRDEAVKEVFPEYDSSYRLKITLPTDLLDSDKLNFYTLTIVSPEGEEKSERLRPSQLRQIVAATNFKQRSRAAMLYYHAELRDFAVIGTPQKNEHDQGFFVKYGDSAMDVQPIGHLYKTQVYQLAEYLDIPEAIRTRPPTSDTYSAASTQEEFFFRLPFELMDLIWYGLVHEIPAEVVASELELEPEQVNRVYADLQRKQRTTNYLRTPPLGLFDEL
ncbi:MAG: NAD(+) synthase [Anaerolineales bacterium]|nr:NAD(+) synthase [Anaerolineales bacterium]MCB8936790.1 NAD(+) synthase [Ardenticatenaceae bacterium]